MIGIVVTVSTIFIGATWGDCGRVGAFIAHRAPWSVQLFGDTAYHSGCHAVLVEEAGHDSQSSFVLTRAGCWRHHAVHPYEPLLKKAETKEGRPVNISETGHRPIGSMLILLRLETPLAFNEYVMPICLFNGNPTVPSFGKTYIDPSASEASLAQGSSSIEQQADVLPTSAPGVFSSPRKLYISTLYPVPPAAPYYAKVESSPLYFLWGVYLATYRGVHQYIKITPDHVARIREAARA